MAFVEQRIATGLVGVTVQDFVGDIPTWGFAGADNPEGFANIGYWSATADYNYAVIESSADTLPVWEGVYLSLAPADSYTLTFSGTMPDSDVVMDIPGDASRPCLATPPTPTLTSKHWKPNSAKAKWDWTAGTPTPCSTITTWMD